jgi:hypothetical protein
VHFTSLTYSLCSSNLFFQWSHLQFSCFCRFKTGHHKHMPRIFSHLLVFTTTFCFKFFLLPQMTINFTTFHLFRIDTLFSGANLCFVREKHFCICYRMWYYVFFFYKCGDVPKMPKIEGNCPWKMFEFVALRTGQTWMNSEKKNCIYFYFVMLNRRLNQLDDDEE